MKNKLQKKLKKIIAMTLTSFLVLVQFVQPVCAATISENVISDSVTSDDMISDEETADKLDVNTEEADVQTEETLTLPASGKSGDLDWSIDSEGHLLVQGKGNYESTDFYYKQGWHKYRTKITKATVKVSDITNTAYMFYECNKLESVDLSGFDTSKVTTMWGMFYGCQYLQSPDFTNFKTGNVKDMGCMFFGCGDFGFDQLDLSSFDTGNVTNMSQMFRQCTWLEEVDLSSFNTENVTSMSEMFSGCQRLTRLDLTNFNTTNVTSMYKMFNWCEKIESITWSKSFDTSKVTSMSSMFYRCWKLKDLDVSNFNTSNVSDMSRMFCVCTSLTDLNVSNFDTHNVTTFSNMFNACYCLETLDLTSFDFSKADSKEDVEDIFMDCYKLVQIDAPSAMSTQELVLPELYKYKTDEDTTVDNKLWYKYKNDVSQGPTTVITNADKNLVLKRIIDEVNITNGEDSKLMLISGKEVQPSVESDMEPVVYQAAEGYYIPDDYVSKLTGLTGGVINGVKVVRDNYEMLTISGNPQIKADITLIPITKKNPVSMPAIIIDYQKEELTGFEKGNTYLLNGTTVFVCSEEVLKKALTEDDLGTDISIVRNLNSEEKNTMLSSEPQIVSVPVRPRKPSVTTMDETQYAKKDGKIVGVNASMEYKASGDMTWINVPADATEITNLAPGSYDIRVKATDMSFAGQVATVEIKEIEKEQEEPKQEEPKQEEPKQEEPKQEEPKQEEPKQEEPQKSVITEEIITSQTSDKDIEGATFGMLKAKAVKNGKTSIKLKWNKVPEADGYIVFGNKCNSDGKIYKFKKLKTLSKNKTTYTAKKLDKGRYYKFLVAAYKNVDGKKEIITVSTAIHSITKGGKYGVAKSVKIDKIGTKKNTTKITLKKGKTAKIKAHEVKESKKISHHRKLVFESSNKNVATVTKTGKIKAKGKGKCKIYVYAQNGVYKIIHVTVK